MFLFSCSENVSIFGPVEEETNYRVETVPDGSILSGELTIPLGLAVQNPEAVDLPSVLEMELFDAGGSIVLATAIEEPFAAGDETPVTALPDLEDGVYTLLVHVRRATEIVETVERQLFVVTGEFDVVQTVVFPPTVEPDSLSIAQAQLAASDQYDPFARWIVGDEVVAEGYWREGADSVFFTTPVDDGVYVLGLELYPYGPESGVRVTAAAPRVHEGNLVVSSERAPGPGELGPRDEFVDLFHFNGNTGNAAPDLLHGGDARASEDARVMIENGVFGYALDGIAEIAVDRTFIPNADATVVADLVILPFAPVDGERLLRSVTDDGSEFAIQVGDPGSIVLRYGEPGGSPQERVVRLSVEAGARLHLTVFVERVGDDLSVSLLSDGVPAQPVRFALSTLPDEVAAEGDREDVAVELVPSLASGTTTFGGSGSVRGILDEFGIRGSSNEEALGEIRDAFVERMRTQHGEALLHADALVPSSTLEPYLIEAEAFDKGAALLTVAAGRNGEPVAVVVTESLPDGSERVVEPTDAGYPVASGVVSVTPEDADGTVTILRVALVEVISE